MIEPRSLVYPSVTTDVDKLGLNACTTKVAKDANICSFSTHVIFVVVDAVLVITASGSPVGGYVTYRSHSVLC